MSAYSGSEALLRVSMEYFDMMLLDLMIPGNTGEKCRTYLEVKVSDGEKLTVSLEQHFLEKKISCVSSKCDSYLWNH